MIDWRDVPEEDPTDDDEDMPCPGWVLTALGFDPDEEPVANAGVEDEPRDDKGRWTKQHPGLEVDVNTSGRRIKLKGSRGEAEVQQGVGDGKWRLRHAGSVEMVVGKEEGVAEAVRRVHDSPKPAKPAPSKTDDALASVEKTNELTDDEKSAALAALRILAADKSTEYAKAYNLDSIKVSDLGMKEREWHPAFSEHAADLKDEFSKVMSVPLQGIGTTQDGISRDGLAAYVQRQPDPKKDGWPEVARFPDGSFCVVSGNTRLGARLLAGKAHGWARVFDVGEDGKLVKARPKQVRNSTEDEARDSHGRWTAGGDVPATLRPKLKNGLYPKSAELHEAAADPAKLEALFKAVRREDRGKLTRLMEQLKPKEAVAETWEVKDAKGKLVGTVPVHDPSQTPASFALLKERELYAAVERASGGSSLDVGKLHDAAREVDPTLSVADFQRQMMAWTKRDLIQTAHNNDPRLSTKEELTRHWVEKDESQPHLTRFVSWAKTTGEPFKPGDAKEAGTKLPPRTEATHALIKQAVGDVNLASLPKLRDKLVAAGIKDREEQDAALLELHRQGKVGFSGWEGRQGITAEEKAALLDVGGQRMGHVYLRGVTNVATDDEPRDEKGRWTKGSLSSMLGLLAKGKEADEAAKDQRTPEELKHAIADKLSAASAHGQLPAWDKEEGTTTLERCLKHCSQAVLARIDAHTSALIVHNGTRSVDAAFEEATQVVVNRTQGFYLVVGKQLHFDGSDEDAKDTLAHELGHAIDGPHYEYSRSEEWHEAHREEIDKPGDPLTAYARVKPCEGFAEFARLVLGGRLKTARRFPKCFAFWQERGLLK